MTPGARIEAAAGILDRIAAGTAAERALTNWARASRYAGSKDRAAVRDHVFDVLRRWRSTAVTGGAETGRARLFGLLRQQGEKPETYFTGEGHAPAPLTEAEWAVDAQPEGPDLLDLPDWLIPEFDRSLGARAREVAEALRLRAPVFLRVNLLRVDLEGAIRALAEDGIKAEPHPLANTALLVTEGARAVARSQAYMRGLVELQDVASQAIVLGLDLRPGARVLDYCAGGGGKALAMAAQLRGPLEAHDIDPARMSDLPVRAARAGAEITPVERPSGAYDLVLCDVPCTGSGAWRRAPEGKWRLTPARLAELAVIQAEILETVAPHVGPNGTLAYATCSVLGVENDQQIDRFLDRHPEWHCISRSQLLPSDGGDGFFSASLTRRG